MAEYLDVIDENNRLTGEVVERKIAHAKGIRHRSVHLWILRKKEGVLQVLLQKRSPKKASFPNCYDISSAGHVDSGEDFKSSAIRELQEELGITAKESDLIFCGDRNVIWDEEFNGKEFHDRQHSKVFMMWLDLEESKFSVDCKEVESVRWMNFEECINGVKHNLFPNCIVMEELQILSKALGV